MIRAGVVGAGMVFGHYARAAAEVADFEIVAVFDRDPQRPRTHDSLDALLDADLDAVLVLTPNAAHAPAVRACLERRIPTLCEKPLAMTADAAHELVDLAARNETLLYAAMHARHRPEVRWLREHVDEPIARFTQTWLEDWRAAPAWYYRAAESGGGVLLDVGINHIDWIAQHLPPLAVANARAGWRGEVEDECAVEWTFDGGAGTTLVSWSGAPEVRHTVIETRRGAKIELLHDRNAVRDRGTLHGPWRNTEYAAVLADFVRAIGDPSTSDSASAVASLALIGRVYEHIDRRRIS